jgi:hypothetical protein
VEEEAGVGIVRILVEMIEPLRVECAGSPDQPVDCIPLGQKQLGEI